MRASCFLDVLRREWRAAKLRRRFPTAVIHAGAVVDDGSRLGEHVVLFPGVRLLNAFIGRYSYVQAGSALYGVDVGPFCSIASRVYAFTRSRRSKSWQRN